LLRPRYRVRALNARIQSMRRTALVGTCKIKAAEPRIKAILL
jgi:hypothetical protein